MPDSGPKRTFRILVALLVAVLLVPGPVLAQLAKAGVVTTVQGSATVARTALPQPAPLKFKDDVFQGDRVATGDNSLARLLLGGKAVITVRERSIVTITETPGTSTVDVGSGYAALSVAKERLRPGESIQLRTPNAIAGIRGTVVLVEVKQATSQLVPLISPASFTTILTLLIGALLVTQRDAAGNPIGPGVTLGPLQQTTVTGSQPPRPPVTLTPEAAQLLAAAYRAIGGTPPGVNEPLTQLQLQQALRTVEAVLADVGVLGGTGRPPRAVSGSSDPIGGLLRREVIEAIKVKLNIAAQRSTQKQSPPAVTCTGSC
jgi:hypothetical protein